MNGAALSPSTQSVLLDRADGNIGRLVTMLEWIAAQTLEPVDLNRMPPLLYGAFEQVWSELTPPGAARRRLELAAAVLAAVREPITRALISQHLVVDVSRMRSASEAALRKLESAGFVTMTPSRSRGVRQIRERLDQRAALSDESLRAAILEKIGVPSELRGSFPARRLAVGPAVLAPSQPVASD